MKEGDILNRNILLSHFYGAWAEALDNLELWMKHSSIYRQSSNDILPNNCHISCLEVAIHNKSYPWLDATIDIVSSFQISNPPEYCRIPQVLSQRGCTIAGKWAPSQPTDQEIFQVGLCLSDAEFFQIMPQVLKDGYKLAKIVKDNAFCPAINNTGMRAQHFITSYILKTITFMIFLHGRALAFRGSTSKCLDKAYILEVTSWARAIYRVLNCALQLRFLESTYIPGCNLLGESKYGQYQDDTIQYNHTIL